jgi:peptide chain release factor 1
MPRWGCGGVFSFEILTTSSGFLTFKATGKGAKAAFEGQSGGHRHQRIPPTERKGRVQTSTVTVAVLSVPNHTELKLDERDLEYKVCRSGGPGGQAVNKVNSAVQLTHLPTGLMVRAEGERSQLQNRETALSILRAKLQEQKTSAASKERNDTRKSQLGSGMRGDKAFTYRWQDGIVTCHANDKKANLDKVLKGFLEDLA